MKAGVKAVSIWVCMDVYTCVSTALSAVPVHAHKAAFRSVTKRHFKRWQSGWKKHTQSRLNSTLDHTDRLMKTRRKIIIAPRPVKRIYMQLLGWETKSAPGKPGHEGDDAQGLRQNETAMAVWSVAPSSSLRFGGSVFGWHFAWCNSHLSIHAYASKPPTQLNEGYF